ncbi:MAG: hypothetical protein K0R50_3732 [Eubacterium sp.]|nr:hypothetical protein [Eubacterium sp.]
MKNRPTVYYTLPCIYEQRPDGEMAMVPQGQQSAPTQPLPPGADPFAPITPTTQPEALTLTSTEYLNGFLRTQIGRRVRVEFLIGTGTLLDRTGTLLSVGANYINIRLIESDDVMTCDFFSIKFITFLL